MLFCDLQDGETAIEQLAKGQSSEVAEPRIVLDPCTAAGSHGRIEAEGGEHFCLSAMLQKKSRCSFQMQIFYVQPHAVRKGDAPEQKVSCPVIHLVEMPKASIYWKSHAGGHSLPDTVGCY